VVHFLKPAVVHALVQIDDSSLKTQRRLVQHALLLFDQEPVRAKHRPDKARKSQGHDRQHDSQGEGVIIPGSYNQLGPGRRATRAVKPSTQLGLYGGGALLPVACVVCGLAHRYVSFMFL